MTYEINISKNGRHYFATHERSGDIHLDNFRAMYDDLCQRFPESEGFKVSASEWERSGRNIEFHHETLSVDSDKPRKRANNFGK